MYGPTTPAYGGGQPSRPVYRPATPGYGAGQPFYPTRPPYVNTATNRPNYGGGQNPANGGGGRPNYGGDGAVDWGNANPTTTNRPAYESTTVSYGGGRESGTDAYGNDEASDYYNDFNFDAIDERQRDMI